MKILRPFASILLSLALITPILHPQRNFASIALDCSAAACVFLPLVPADAPVEIESLYHRQLRYENIESKGSIVNRSSRPVYDVIIEGNIYDGSDRLIGTAVKKTDLAMTLPGGYNSFEMSFHNALLSDVARIEVKIISWSLESDKSYATASVVVQVNQPGVNTYLAGTVRNDQGVALEDVTCLLWWDSPGEYPHAFQCADRLEPGQTANWEQDLYLYGLPGGIPAAEGQGAVAP